MVPIRPRIVAFYCASCEVTTEVPLHPEAEAPSAWPCHRCREEAEVVDVAAEDAGEPLRSFTATPANAKRPAKSHWDHVCERRTIPELEEILERRLQALRDGTLFQGTGY